MTKATIAVLVDWNNDLDWGDTGETVTTRVLHSPGITTVRGRDQIRALAPPMAGSCDFSLNNQSKDYSPENASSPLYGNLVPGRAIKITANGSDLWRGNVDDLPQQPRLRGGSVGVPGLGTLAKLKGTIINSHLYTNITTDVAFAHVCRLAGLTLTTHYAALDTGKTTLTAWWCNQSDAFAMLVSILAAEGPGAAIYESPSGVITFHSRHYRLLTSRCTTSQATFGDGVTEPKHSPLFGYEPNLKGVVNQCAITVGTATPAGAPSVVWTWTGSVQVVVGQTVVFPISLTAPAKSFVATFTFTGGGMSTVFTSEGVGVTAAGAAYVELRLDNSDVAGQPTTLTGISVSATAYTLTSETVRNSVDTSASQGKYGLKKLGTNWTPWPYIDANVGRDFCNAIVNAYQEPRATVTVTIKNANATRLTQQLAREISDRVTVQESQTGISGDVYIERIKHTITEGGLFHTTEFGCEKVPTSNYGLWGSGLFGTATWGF